MFENDEALTIRADAWWDGTSAIRPHPVAVTVDRGTIVRIEESPDDRGERANHVVLQGRTLLPGFIDCHVHLVDEQFDLQPVEMQTLRSLSAMRTLLHSGFTTARDLGGRGGINVALRDAVDDGLIDGPRLFVAPNILSPPGGHGDKKPAVATAYGRDVGTLASGVEAIELRVRQQVRLGADWIKFAASGGFTSSVDKPTATSYTQREMTALVAAATDMGRPVAAHAFNSTSVRRAIEARVRGVEHAGLIDAATLSLIEESGVYLIPTLFVQRYFIEKIDDDGFWPDPRLRDKFREYAPAMRAAAEGIGASAATIVFGTDAGMFPHAQNWREFETMIDVGIDPYRALRSATSVAADLLGRPDLGRIRVGATADLIACPGNPVTDIKVLGRVDFVMQNGIIRRSPNG
ncbi:amidohydrolase family protein [Nocardia sp. NPDC003482]